MNLISNEDLLGLIACNFASSSDIQKSDNLLLTPALGSEMRLGRRKIPMNP